MALVVTNYIEPKLLSNLKPLKIEGSEMVKNHWKWPLGLLHHLIGCPPKKINPKMQ